MNFRKLDQHTVQCILSEEEMHSYGFKIEDFFTDQEKARDFLEQLVEKAEEEVGYEANGGMVSMQIMKMPNNDLSITFSERDPMEGMQSMIQQLHQQLTGMMDGENHSEAEKVSENESQNMDTSENLEEQKDVQTEVGEKNKKSQWMFYFQSYADLVQFVLATPSQKNIPGAVYLDEEEKSYYLLAKKGKYKKEEWQDILNLAKEFGSVSQAPNYTEEYCREHFTVFIPKKAVSILKKIEAGI